MEGIEIFDYKNFNSDSLVYEKPVKQNKTHLSPVNYLGKRYMIQTPKLRCTNIGENHLNLELTDTDFYEYISDLDQKNINACCQNSKEWFKGKQLPLEVVENGYKPTIVPSKKSGGNCEMRINVERDELMKVVPEIYDRKRNQIDYKDIQKDGYITCIIEFKGLNIKSQMISSCWNLYQLKFYNEKPKEIKYLIQDSPDSDKESVKSVESIAETVAEPDPSECLDE